MNNAPPSILPPLMSDPCSFQLVQALRILHHAHGNGRSIMDFIRQDIRMRPHLSLAFAPTDIVSLEESSPEDRKKGAPPFIMTVSMLALYGAASPLPTFYTEDLLEEQRQDRSAARDFLDIVNQPFYEAFIWRGWVR